MHTGPMGGTIAEKVFQLFDMGGGQFALLDPEHPNGPYIFADYNADGSLNTNPDLIHDWWKFTIASTDGPTNPDAAAYLAANPDLAAVFGSDYAAALAHYQQYGWAEGRPTGASDVSVGADGTTFYVSTSAKVYSINDDSFGILGSDHAQHIDVGSDGTVWFTRDDHTVGHRIPSP